MLLAIIATLTIFVSASSAAPKVDPELSARLRAARPEALLGVVLTFHGNRITDAHIKAVEALGINVGVRMRNFPIMGVNASPAQIQRLLGWNDLRSVYLNTPLQLYLHQRTPESLVAESLRKEGVMRTSGGAFTAGASVSRLEQGVALVRALRLDTQAKALVNSNVTSRGQVLTDNAQIPGTLRGYVQIALDRGLMEAFPAEVRESAPGQFQAFPGPRFEPNRIVKRAEFLNPASRLINMMFGE